MIRYVALDRLYASYRTELLQKLDEVYSTGQVKKGVYTKLVEQWLQDYLNVEHVIFTTSGTTALTAGLIALGVRPGDEVITSNYSYVASANQINLLGATPVFVDVDEHGLIDCNKVSQVITNKTKAILPVSLYGNAPDYSALREFGLPILADCAQSLGSKDGSFGDYNTFSFATNKPVPTLGTAGAISTNLDRADIDTILRCGKPSRNAPITHQGINGEPMEEKAIQVYLGLLNMEKWQTRRTEISEQLAEHIAHIPADNWHKFIALVEDREGFQKYMTDKGIETQIHYTDSFADSILCNQKNNTVFEKTQHLIDRVVSLPNHQFLTDQEVQTITNALKEYNHG